MNYCTRNDCFRAGPDVGNCADALGIIGCPKPKEVDSARVVVLHCAKCNKTRAFPTNSIMKAQIIRNLCTGDMDQCQAVIVFTQQTEDAKKAPKRTAKPPVP